MVENVRERRRKPNPPMVFTPLSETSSWTPVNVPAYKDMFIGIDASLTNTGLVALRAGSITSKSLESKKLRGAERLAWFRNEFTHELQDFLPRLVAIEGYAFGAKNQREALGELGGILRLVLHDLGVPYIVVSPNSLKLFITGKGSGPKDNMSKEIYKRYGVDLTDNNQVDAAGLAVMALAHEYSIDLTEFQKRALSKLD